MCDDSALDSPLLSPASRHSTDLKQSPPVGSTVGRWEQMWSHTKPAAALKTKEY